MKIVNVKLLQMLLYVAVTRGISNIINVLIKLVRKLYILIPIIFNAEVMKVLKKKLMIEQSNF